MWLLLFLCMSTVGGVPINSTQEASSHAPAGDVLLNDTLHADHGAQGEVSMKLKPELRASAETLADLQEDMIVQEGDILTQMNDHQDEVKADMSINKCVQSCRLYRRTGMLWRCCGWTRSCPHEEGDFHTAFQMISDYTCIHFVPHSNEYNYLEFKTGKGCASFVGCRGGAQPLYHSQKCSVGNLCHEIIHALGLHHEHTRKDRDDYVAVQWDSIMPGREKNFALKYGNTQNLPYDINSIMHYGSYFFSVDGNPTVLPFEVGVQMGQRTHLSHLDIQRINKLYHCDERKK
ncbi:hatching enzyme 1.2 isoform X1 [Labrus bergylta]|uniref:hatching enzyme 1.2 isoform X1 n=1 Tax=Labrus bergylta TaxID=56723 RepID=UPI0033138B66